MCAHAPWPGKGTRSSPPGTRRGQRAGHTSARAGPALGPDRTEPCLGGPKPRMAPAPRPQPRAAGVPPRPGSSRLGGAPRCRRLGPPQNGAGPKPAACWRSSATVSRPTRPWAGLSPGSFVLLSIKVCARCAMLRRFPVSPFPRFHPFRWRLCRAGWIGGATAGWRPGPFPGAGNFIERSRPLALFLWVWTSSAALTSRTS